MEKSLKIPIWIEAILWTAAAALCVSGYVFCGFIACGVAAFCVGISIFITKTEKLQNPDIEVLAAFLLAGIGLTLYGWSGLIQPIILIALLWCLVYSFVIYKKGQRISVAGICTVFISLICMLFSTIPLTETDSDYLAFKNKLAVFRGQVEKLPDFDDEHKRLLLDNPFNGFFTKNLIVQNCQRQRDSCSYYNALYASLYDAFKESKQKDDIAPLIDKYEDKSEKLYIKRLWLSSKEMPWTYSAYGKIKMSTLNRNGLFHHENRTSLNNNYHAVAAGDFNVDYVNIIFSDNKFQRYKVADAPEWLAAKEGDQILAVYRRRNFDYGENWLNNLEEPDFEWIFDKEYYLTLKITKK